jgi:hypothetical protein
VLPDKEGLMAVAFLQEFKITGADRSTTNYDAISAKLDLDTNPAVGLVAHSAGWDEEGGVFRIFDVWETREHAEAFMRDRLQPILEEGPANPDNAAMPDREGMYELHDVVRG